MELQVMFLVLAIVLPLLLFVGSYLVIRRTPQQRRRSAWAYVLVWPRLFEKRALSGTGRLLSYRELIGWGLVLVLIIVVFAFDL